MMETSGSRHLSLKLLVLAIVAVTVPAQAQLFTVLHPFTGTPDGAGPAQSTLLDVNGVIYGTTDSGGADGFGTVFKLNSHGEEVVLYSFTGGADGANPDASLVRDSKGNLYGTAQSGGDLNCAILGLTGCGVVYKLDTSGKQTVLYTFKGGTDGAGPQGLIIDNAGNLYGPTFQGGDLSCGIKGGCGVVYKIDSGGTETSLFSFEFGTTGTIPNGFLTRDMAGNLYGVTIDGGDLAGCSGIGCGVVFKLDTSGNESVLYTFTGGADGAGPNGALLLDSKGNLYGTAFAGGDLSCSNQSSVGCGVVFELTTAGTERVLHTFKGMDGANPSLGLLRDAKGNFFSTTVYGGTFNMGTVFEITATGGERVLHSFSGLKDGGLPESGLFRDAKANLYSNTVLGGDPTCSCGTVFRLVSPPHITTFSPASGAVGTPVAIDGVSLSQTTRVTFGGVKVTTLTLNSDLQITATVPTGALTGKISITTPGGTAMSTSSFTVIP
jgi:uncharacterized repeat protein (TIGR03803 family)